MHSKIDFDSAIIESLTFDALSGYSEIPLGMSQAKKLKIKQGSIIAQSIHHYLGHIELFECALSKSMNIRYVIKEPTYFMYMALYENCSCLIYRRPGRYQTSIPARDDKVLLITLKTDWLLHRCKSMPELLSIVTGAYHAESQELSKPVYGMVYGILNSLKKFNSKTDPLNFDTLGYLFINDCINRYYTTLTGQASLSLHHQQKIRAIAQFIKENYATELVDNLPGLATRFMISERHLERLAKQAFGISLHMQVIKIRMNSGIKQLITTDKKVYEISKLVGYKEPFYFSRAFKKYFGISPKHIRNM